METTTGFEEVEGHPYNVHAHRYHRFRGWNVKRRRKVATCDHLIPADHASSKARGQKLTSTPPLMYVMKYMVPSMLALVTLNYQGKPESLFRENPAPMWCFLAATSVYWLIVGAVKQITTINNKRASQKLLSNAAFASGVLSALSLISVFIPYPVSLVPLFIWIPLPLVLARPILYHAYTLLKRGITIHVIDRIQLGIVVSSTRGGLSSKEEASNLPV